MAISARLLNSTNQGQHRDRHNDARDFRPPTNRAVGNARLVPSQRRPRRGLQIRRPCMTSERRELSFLRPICRPFVIVRRVVRVRIHRGLRPSEPPGDLPDRETLGIAVVASKRRSPARSRTRSPAGIADDDTGRTRRLPNVLDSHPSYCETMLGTAVTSTPGHVRFPRIGSRVASRFTIEQFRLSSRSSARSVPSWASPTADRRHCERSRPSEPRFVTSSQVEYQRAALACSRRTVAALFL